MFHCMHCSVDGIFVLRDARGELVADIAELTSLLNVASLASLPISSHPLPLASQNFFLLYSAPSACAAADSLASLLVLRFFAGFFGSVPNTKYVHEALCCVVRIFFLVDCYA